MSKKLRVTVAQIDVRIGEPAVNEARVLKALHQATEQQPKPDIVILPEMWNTGYALTELHSLADRDGQRTKQVLSEAARQHGLHLIAGSVSELRGEDAFNTMYVFDREGQLAGEYSKLHLFRLMQEDQYLRAGDQLGQLELEGLQAGMMICYDIRFPELTRKLALSGAKVLFVSAQWPKPRLHHWRTILMARAIENQMYVVACNRVGRSGDTEFFGHSMIIDPWGDVIAEGGEEETLLTADLDLDLVEDVRRRIPIFQDRRPELY